MAINISAPVFAHSELTAQGGMVTASTPGRRVSAPVCWNAAGTLSTLRVATAFAAGVLLPLSNGIGGGGLRVLRKPDGSTACVDYGMVTGENASPGMFEYEDALEAPDPDAHRMSRRFAAPAVVNHENVQGHRSIQRRAQWRACPPPWSGGAPSTWAM